MAVQESRRGLPKCETLLDISGHEWASVKRHVAVPCEIRGYPYEAHGCPFRDACRGCPTYVPGCPIHTSIIRPDTLVGAESCNTSGHTWASVSCAVAPGIA